MRYIIGIALLSLLISCKKNKETPFVFGNGLNMVVNETDYTVKAPFKDDYVKEEIEIDLNHDGLNDVEFSSSADTLNTEGGGTRWWLKMRLKHDNIELFELANSNIRYETFGPKVYDYYGTMPRESRTLTYSCEKQTGSVTYNTQLFPSHFTEEAEMNVENYTWQNFYKEFNLAYSAQKEDQLGWNETSDTILWTSLREDPSCYNMPFNSPFYLVFRMRNHTDFKIGWMELMITEENRLTLLSSAISADPVDF